ncbi:TlpA family protein disulfide reductase [Streptomyces sp. PCS3-D2]|uniref:TlpA family protein disulfide reductase n=1 Tax=Streptomyces sp. PCS3-D2 TaxID=1460244 RepID=UPI0007C85288|nr:TlpA disulfide reductase family protein [Streptomyces sp. PCS3-D2]WKV75353.1 TlpA family protein disulfide reductase [Streptomyces sp. PCS3-D2]
MRRPGRTSPVAPAVTGLAVAAALAAAGLWTDDRPAAGLPAGQPGTVGAAAGAKVMAPGIRPDAPALAGADLDGRRVALGDFRGQVVVLNAWGSRCAPCRAEADDLERLSRQTRADGVRFLGINTRDPDRAAARSFVRAHGLTFPSFHDPDGDLLLRFPPSLVDPHAIPSVLVIDRRGRVAAALGGAVTDEQLRPLLTRLLAEEP